MNATAEMLEVRLALIERLHRVELELAREEHARAAAALLRGKIHQLGNAVQIVQLSSLELERRSSELALAELVHDLREGADGAAAVLAEMIAAAAPPPRTSPGAAVAPVLRAALELARPAIAARLELACELADSAHTLATEPELEALVLVALLDAADAGAARITLVARPRTIGGNAFVQLLRLDDRGDRDAATLPALVDALAIRASGEASLAPGRDALELAIELPSL